MYCPNCGKQIESDGLYCPDCGTAIKQVAASAPPELIQVEPFAEQHVANEQVNSLYSPVEAGQPEFASPQYSEPQGQPEPPVLPQAGSAVNPAVSPGQAYAPVAAATAAPAKKKSKLPVIIVSVVLGLALLIGGGFGIYAYMQSSKYNTAIETFESAQTGANRASTVPAFESAQELFTTAKASFDELGEYEDAMSYSTRCSSGITLCNNNIAYLNAMARFDAGDYEAAQEAFNALGGFSDSAEMSLVCGQYILYLEAVANYENGAYDDALEVFSQLKDQDFEDSADWYQKTRYAQAEQLVAAGDLYGAYKIFKALGSYEDAADRASNCTTAFPSSGELYHHDSYRSSSVTMNFNGDGLYEPRYIKVYDGGTLVSTVFVNPNNTVSINLPAGNYTFKESSGSIWFGDQVMFGDEGDYWTLVFNGSESTYLESNYIYTLTLYVQGGGNVGSSGTNRNNF